VSVIKTGSGLGFGVVGSEARTGGPSVGMGVVGVVKIPSGARGWGKATLLLL